MKYASKVKRWFITLFPLLSLLMAIHSVSALFKYGNLDWLGASISTVAVVLCFTWIFIGNVARTQYHLMPFTVAVTTGALLALLGALVNDGHEVALIYAAITLAGWLTYDYWYARLERPDNTLIEVGQPLPEFTLEDEHGNTVSSTSWRGQYTVLLFYRGNWCPLCSAQIRELADYYQQLLARKVQIALISPQPHAMTKQLAQKLDVAFQYLVDVDSKVAEQLQIDAPDGTPAGLELLGYQADTVFPTVIITDPDGKVIFCDLTDNYRVRPEPETFLDIIDSHKSLKA